MTPVPELEIDMVREFSHSGLKISPESSPDARCEMIRLAIYREKKEAKDFRRSGITYAQAFERCYGQKLDKRRPVAVVVEDEDSDDLPL